MSANIQREFSPSARASVDVSGLVVIVAVAIGLLAAGIGGVSLGLSISTASNMGQKYDELEREVRLLQLQTDNMKSALLAADIDPSPHLKGEAP